jgi:SAM-dependent methyltransferase
MSEENEEQIELWNGRSGARWVRHQASLDRVMAPIGSLAIERAAVSPGERVIDVGCGCGATTLALASKVGVSGSVLGADVSAPMLARARERARGLGLGQVDWVEADASTHAFPVNADLVFSRFGVMFFRSPIVAFANLRRALRPGGRLVFASWRSLELNDWMTVPMTAAATVVPPEVPLAPHQPGPFSLSDEERLRSIVASAGFVDTLYEPIVHDLVLGEDVESATDFSLDAGPTSRLLLHADDQVRARVRAAVKQALQPHLGSKGVTLRAATWVVRAHA